MNTGTKVWLTIAAVLLLIGGALFAGVMSTLEWDFMQLSTVKYETNTHEIGEVFDSISMNTDTADIVLAMSDDGQCRVECREDKNAKHAVAVADGTLSVTNADRAARGFIGITFGSPKITVYLPKAEYRSLLIKASTGDVELPKGFTFQDADISLSTGDVEFCASVLETVTIKTSTGDIRVKDISAGALELSVSTGEVTASGVNCKSVTSSGNTGDILLNTVVAAEKISVKRTTGDVRFDGTDAAEIVVETDTGDVRGNLLTDKVFITKTDTGHVDVPNTAAGGRCEITTDTGDIVIAVD